MTWKLLGISACLCLITVAPAAPVLRAETAVVRFTGQPKFDGGDALGYFIWKDGDTWKLRWTTFGSNHRFSGRITVEDGAFTDFDRIDVDTERKVIAPGRPGRVVRGPRGRPVGVAGGRAPVVASREEDKMAQETERLIVFNTLTDDDTDGLNFKVNGATRMLRFVLEIDGVPRPAEVEVGRENFKPNENPLVVRVR